MGKKEVDAAAELSAELRAWGDRLRHTFEGLANAFANAGALDGFKAALQAITQSLGPMAPTRKRPKRVAKKIAKRGGRLRYPRSL